MLEEERKLKLMQIHRELDSFSCDSLVSVSEKSSNIDHVVDRIIIDNKISNSESLAKY